MNDEAVLSLCVCVCIFTLSIAGQSHTRLGQQKCTCETRWRKSSHNDQWHRSSFGSVCAWSMKKKRVSNPMNKVQKCKQGHCDERVIFSDRLLKSPPRWSVEKLIERARDSSIPGDKFDSDDQRVNRRTCIDRDKVNIVQCNSPLVLNTDFDRRRNSIEERVSSFEWTNLEHTRWLYIPRWWHRASSRAVLRAIDEHPDRSTSSCAVWRSEWSKRNLVETTHRRSMEKSLGQLRRTTSHWSARGLKKVRVWNEGIEQCVRMIAESVPFDREQKLWPKSRSSQNHFDSRWESKQTVPWSTSENAQRVSGFDWKREGIFIFHIYIQRRSCFPIICLLFENT